MSSQRFPCRVSGLMATQAPVCVLLRRGPTRWTQVVRWNTVTDEFKLGQWIRARVYESNSRIAPDGEHWMYVALKHDRGLVDERIGPHRRFLAVSRVPDFRPVLSWPVKDRWGRVCEFVTSRDVALGLSPDEYAAGGTNAAGGITAKHWSEVTSERAQSSTRRPAWTSRRVEGQDFVVEARSLPDGSTLVRRERDGRTKPKSYRVRYVPADAEGLSIPDCHWIDVDQQGRVVLARDGVVLRWEAPGVERVLIDLNESRPPAGREQAEARDDPEERGEPAEPDVS